MWKTRIGKVNGRLSQLGRWLWGWIQAPNLPVLAGVGILTLGLLMVLLSLKAPWYRVPADIDAAGELVYATAVSEKPLKAIFALGLLTGIGIALYHWFKPIRRGQSLFSIGVLGFLIGLIFAHLVVVDEAALSHQAAWVVSQHDGLTWLGGDIYTAREYEPAGGGLDLMIKDPPQILGVVPLPHRSADLAILHDWFEWMGLGSPFTTFKVKGWGFLMVGSIFVMVGAMATRRSQSDDQLSPALVSFGLRAAGLPVLLFLSFVGTRAWLAAGALQDARALGDNARYAEAAQRIERAMKHLPCIGYDTGLLLQLGLYHYQSRQITPAARYFRAVRLESANLKTQAEAIYASLTNASHEAIRREAHRALFRLGIIDFNSGQETEALRLTEAFIQAFPALPKARYVRFLLAMRLGEVDVAYQCHRDLYTIAKGIGLGEKRAYLSSGHQHLGELAFSQGDYHEAWQQFVYRIQLEK